MDMPVGTLANAGAIVAGSLVGLLMHGRFPENVKKIVFQGLGLAVLVIGLQMALAFDRPLLMVFSLVLGGICGELLRIEDRLESMGERLKALARSRNALFTEGFVAASLIYCVGSMAILGSIDDGLRQDPTILFTKATLDGFASIPLASTYGVGVMFSAVPILLYQGAITLAAGSVREFATPQLLAQLSSVGGFLILSIGVNLLGLARIKVGNLLPALAWAAALCFTPI
ncbi:putative membrane protein YdfK [Fundidesulfovibrio magnetotacticus]|uniref:Putative membrane protein YdfK n=1 Tax=Fundidesulfovibrio magnetotacticus TaxID=2730080 RepID=A0A6V8LQ15_9BACT|nr:DUF554 domain-containing protein [Fundidesulfovibrio magnetotacticus]GFK92209.1 putative membrane protein YdfK [Fundidesulfovibrio magnetotacticus]